MATTAIDRIDDLKPNVFPRERKEEWIAELDERMKREIYDNYLPADGKEKQSDADLLSQKLDRVYLHWLEAQIDYWMGETASYNNAIATFDAEYAEYAREYHKRHRHREAGVRWF